MTNRRLWLLLILLVAAVLRLVALSEVPPGLTHDEADHGLDAWGVVNGVRPIYFTVGYGREPLYDYSTAGLMSFTGPTYLAGRLTAVYFGLILVAASYAWLRRAFGHRPALFAAAALAVSFWGVMTSRQGLRSVTLPAIFALAIYFFWRGLQLYGRPAMAGRPGPRQSPLVSMLVAGGLLGLSFYTYLPARLLWLIIPAQLFYLALFARPLFRRAWQSTAAMLLLAGLVGLPLFAYLAANPTAEARLEQLDDPLLAVRAGDWRPLLTNVAAGLGLLLFRGDDQWRYNIPGRPFLFPLLGLLFVVGLVIIGQRLIRQRRSDAADQTLLPGGAAAFLALAWLAAGLAPALITGAELSTTRIVGLQPVLFIFPALGLTLLEKRFYRPTWYVPAAIMAMVLVFTVTDYFSVWANAPEVRVQYETALTEAIGYLNEHGTDAAAISTTTPNRFHSPAVALLNQTDRQTVLRWFNGQYSLVAPQSADSKLIFTGFAPLNRALREYFAAEPDDILPLRPTDLDRPLTVYHLNGLNLQAQWSSTVDTTLVAPAGAVPPLTFGAAADFLGYDLQTPVVAAGEAVRLVTLWRVRSPLPEGVLFSQVLGSDGQHIAQADRLDVPSYFWIPGDMFLQLHEFTIPEGTAPGIYPILIGLYTRSDLARLPVLKEGEVIGDAIQLLPLRVGP
jgi:hypothetical protein